MAQNTTIACPAGVWTLLTNSDATSLRAVCFGPDPIWLQATVGATPPSGAGATSGALPLLPGQVMTADITLASFFPGVSGANRVYALSPSDTSISVSHA